MFTGIVEQLGRVRAVQPTTPPAPGQDVHADGVRLTIEPAVRMADLAVGESVAVDGVCLTVVERGGGAFSVEATPETLRCTSLGALRPGDAVHLERALAANGRLGGHFVQGHVDAVSSIVGRRPEGDSVVVTFAAPAELRPYLVPKGSVAVDGVSLTVVDVLPGGFTVALIPHTLEVTLLGKKPLGALVNLEADILAKYVTRAVEYAEQAAPRGVAVGAATAVEVGG